MMRAFDFLICLPSVNTHSIEILKDVYEHELAAVCNDCFIIHTSIRLLLEGCLLEEDIQEDSFQTIWANLSTLLLFT